MSLALLMPYVSFVHWPSLQISENRIIGAKGIYMASTDALQITGNVLDPSSNAVR